MSMAILSDVRERVESLAARGSLDVEGSQLLAALRRFDDGSVIDIVALASDIKHNADRIIAVGAAVLAERSTREMGQAGAAATRGHATPVALVQSITGGTRGDAARAVRIGESMVEGQPLSSEPAVVPWHDCLRRALLDSVLTSEQHDAILRGLGKPPIDGVDVDPDAVRSVWARAALQLIDEASAVDVEELARRARQVRDALDPVGAEARFARRFEGRLIRRWVDDNGGHHARIDFDDETAALWDAVIASALRPRRGGPRFMTAEERAAADELVADPRTNEQLTYDLVMDIFRAGTLAEASDVFGSRQPGVRLVVVKDAIGPRDAFGRMLTTGHLEDGGDAVPGSVIDRVLCEAGFIEVTVDSCGNPLDVGREQRLFTTKQRLALAVRDGGCLWPECRVPASYCEAHHSTPWSEGGQSDIEVGVLLCRFHHMLLHNAGWRITRDGKEPFVLHRPPGIAGDSIVLRSRSAVRWAWDPPPPDMRVGWRSARAPE